MFGESVTSGDVARGARYAARLSGELEADAAYTLSAMAAGRLSLDVSEVAELVDQLQAARDLRALVAAVAGSALVMPAASLSVAMPTAAGVSAD